MNVEQAAIAEPTVPTIATEVPAPPQDTPAVGAPSTTPEPFLRVNDRTSYDTREAAVDAFDSAGKRIAELSPWGEFAQRYQFKSAEEAEAVLAEYLDLKRQAEAAAQAVPPVATDAYEKMSNEDIVSRSQSGDAKATAEWERRWVAQQAEKAGYVKKDYVDKRFTELQTSQQEKAQESRRTHAITEGGSILGELLLKEGIDAKENAELVEAAHDNIENWIVRQSRDAKGEPIPGSLEEQFFASAEGRRKVIEQGVQRYLKSLGGYVAKKTAATSTQKEKAIATAPKPLPPGNTSAPPAAKDKKSMSFDDPDFKREVREMFVK